MNWTPIATTLMPEDLPENAGKRLIPCIVTRAPVKGKKKPTTHFVQRVYDEGRGWYWQKLGNDRVTAWMPMPAPYEGGSDDC